MRALPAALFLLAIHPLSAHVMSVSSGELVIGEASATYTIRLPLYEVQHLDDAKQTVTSAINVSGAGAERTAASCETDHAESQYVCRIEYALAEQPSDLDITCRLAEVTVPNHVHVLQATGGTVTTQAVFDYTSPEATVRFEPPGFWELVIEPIGVGVSRVLLGPAQILFVLALALAVRARKEIPLLAASFCLGQIVAALACLQFGWQPPGRFVEAAAALTVAYLASEILLLPDAGLRWLIAAGMGAFHGIYFAGFLSAAQSPTALFFLGVCVAEVALLSLFLWLLAEAKEHAKALYPIKSLSVLLLVTGIAWFLLRLRG